MYPKIIYSILFILIGISGTFGKTTEVFVESKTIHKSYSAADLLSLDITNKYGTIRINTWNSDSIRFEIRIKSESPKSDVAKNMADMTDVEFIQGFHKLSAKTFFSSKLNFFKQGIQDITTSLNPNQKITIDYIVFLPKKIALKIENRFGNIYMDDMSNAIDIILSHGNFEAGNLVNLKSIDMKYGDINISTATNLDVSLQFGTLTLKKMQALKLKSLNSTINIETLSEIWLNSKSDKIKLGTLYKYNGNASFSDIQIEELVTSFLQTGKYGNTTIYKVKSQFTDISVNGNNTTYTLGFENDCSFNFNIAMTYEKGFNYVSSKYKVEKKSQTEDVKTYGGTVNAKSSKMSNVTIDLKSSRLFLS